MASQPSGPSGPALQPPAAPRAAEPRPGSASGRRAVVGQATAMRGQLAAREDLWIEGQFEGEIQAPEHQVTVSPGGRVHAELKARAVVIEGELQGNVVASEMVIVRAGGRMQGDILAPRVGLEEGCHFQGLIDMNGTRVAAPALAPPAPGVAGTAAPIAVTPAARTVPEGAPEAKGPAAATAGQAVAKGSS